MSDLDRSENTKVIVRTFDMPTNIRNIHPPPQPSIGVKYPVEIQTRREKFRYIYKFGADEISESSQSQSLIPQVTRVYPGRKARLTNQAVSASQLSLSDKIALTMKQKLKDSRSLQSISEQVSKRVLSQPVKEVPIVLLPLEHKNLSEKISLNNKSQVEVGNAVELVESKIVNGKKILILKTVKDVGKGTSILQPFKTDSLSSQINLQKESKVVFPGNKRISLIQCGSAIGSGAPQINSAQSVPISNITPNKSSNLLSGEVNYLDTSKPRHESSVQTSVGNSEVSFLTKTGNIDQQQIGKTLTNAPIIIVDKLDSTVNLKTNNSQNGTQCVSDTSYNQAKYVKLDSAVEVSNLNKNDKKTVCLEIMLEKDARKSVEDKSALASNSGVLKNLLIEAHSPAIKPLAMKRKLVPSNSTAYGTQQISEGTGSEKQLKFISSAMDVHPRADHNQEIPYDDVSAIQNSDQMNVNCPFQVPIQNCDSLINNSLNSRLDIDPKGTWLQQNKNEELLRRREQIALQFQQEALKATVVPRNVKTVNVPARMVEVVDVAVQTSLYSLFEHGRFVEMHFKKDSVKGGKNSEYSNIENEPLIGKPIYFSQNLCSSNDRVVEGIPESGDNDKSSSAINLRENILEAMGSESSKRMRMDSGGGMFSCSSDNLVKNSNTTYQSQTEMVNELDSQMMPTNVDQFNTNSDIPQNVNDKITSVCKKISGHLYNLNQPEILKKSMLSHLLKDYRESSMRDEDGNLPIHNAVLDKDAKRVRRLLHVLKAQKRSVDEKNTNEETPLHLAVLCRATEIARDLLNSGADPTIPDNRGDTALHMAVAWGNVELFKAILRKVDVCNAVLNIPNDDGYSPLHLCALNNKCEEAVMLIRKGADINLRDRKSGRTPLFHAVESSNSVMSRKLIDLGASTTVQNFSGHTPLNASEMNLAVPGTDKDAKEELYVSLCQNVAEFNVSKATSSIEAIESVQPMTNFVLLGTKVVNPSELSLNIFNGNIESSQNSGSTQMFLQCNNR